MKQSFRAFTFVSDDDSEDSSMHESGTNSTATPVILDDDSDESSTQYFEDPEFIVASILKGIISKRPRLSSPPASVEQQEESEHQRSLRLRAERFRAVEQQVNKPVPVNKVPPPPPPQRLYSNPFLFPVVSKKTVLAVQQVLKDSPTALVPNAPLPKKLAASVQKAAKPHELALDMLHHLKTPQISLQDMMSKLHSMFTASSIQYSVSKENPSVLIFPVPLQLDDELFHWMQVRHSFVDTSVALPKLSSPGCIVYSFGPTMEEFQAKKHRVYDLRWLGTAKLSRHAELFALLSSGDFAAKVDAVMRNKCNGLFLMDEDEEEFTVAELCRIRRDLLRLRNNLVDRQQFIKQALEFRGEKWADFFKQQQCSCLYGARMLVESGEAQLQYLNLGDFASQDWVTEDKFVNEDNGFSNKVANFLFKARVKFKRQHRLMLVSSPLKLEDKDVRWIVPVNSMIVFEEEIAKMKELVALHGSGAAVFVCGHAPDLELPAGVVAVDWRLLGVDE